MAEIYINNSPITVQLNRELPFVKAVYDVIEGRGDLDTAVQILKLEEQAYGVFIRYDEFHALWGWDLMPKQAPLNATQMLALARTDWDKFMENYVEANDPAYNNFQQKLNRFLDATNLVLQGDDFASKCLLTLDDGSIWTFAYREWGEYLFDWGKQNKWMQKFGSYDEVDFAFYGNRVVKDYRQWVDTALAVIKQKCSS